jgi:hypothetical protein
VQLNNVKPEDVVRTDEQTRKKLLNHCRHVMRLCDEAQRSASHAIEPKVRAHWKQGGGAVTDRERRERNRRELEEFLRRIESRSPWHVIEQEFSGFLPTMPKLRAEIEAGKAEWAKRRKQSLSDTERARLAQVLSSGAGRGFGLARFLQPRE